MKFPSIEQKGKVLLAGLFIALGANFLTACEEGPMEEAGEEIDDAIDDVEDEL